MFCIAVTPGHNRRRTVCAFATHTLDPPLARHNVFSVHRGPLFFTAHRGCHVDFVEGRARNATPPLFNCQIRIGRKTFSRFWREMFTFLTVERTR